MSSDYSDGLMKPTKLVCQSPVAHPLSFEDTFSDAVRVRIGEVSAIMTRNEIAALAALWPVLPRRSYQPAGGTA
jgi:hypothetical protein